MSPSTKKSDASAAFHAAVAYLARRDHTRLELQRKLRGKGFSKLAINGALDRCEELSYLDDEKTAGILCAQLGRKGYGPRRIQAVMQQKGIASHIIEKELNRQCDRKWECAAARRVLEKKRASLARETDGRKRRQKAYRFLAGRGFASEVIRQTIDELWGPAARFRF